jgi:hypothetical protein
MNGQVLRTTDAAPTIELLAFSSTDGTPVTTLAFGTAGLTLSYRRGISAVANITLVTQTATGAWASGGFAHLGGGVYRLDVPVAASASGVTDVTVFASALPAGTLINPAVVALTPDDLTVAAATDATITSAVWSAGTRELTTISASIREAIADTLLGRTIAGAANGGRTVTSALRALRNRVTRVGATLTVYAEDDTTSAFTAALTTDSAAATITGVDPS